MGKTSNKCGGTEDAEAEHEEPPLTEEVGEATAEEEKAAEGDHVGVEDPLKVRLRHAEGALDEGECDADDRGVEDNDELGGAE